MGRYYKTSSPQSLDFMYKLPQELLLRATQQASEDITQNQTALFALADKLQLPSLQKDSDRAKAKVAEYEQKVADLSQTLQENPLEFRRKSGDIIGLGREIQKDWTTGEAAAIISRYKGKIDSQETLRKQIESGHIKDPQAVPYLLQSMEDETPEFKYDAATGMYPQWRDQPLVPHVNVADKYMKILEKVKAHTLSRSGASVDKSGNYIIESGNTREVLTKQELESIAMQQLMGDEETLGYLRQRSKIGMLEGYTDKNGDILSPYGKISKNKKGESIYGFNDTKLGSILAGVVDMFDRDEITASHSNMKAEPYKYAQFSSDLTTVKAAAPDAYNTPIPVRTVPPTIGQFKQQASRERLDNTITYATNSIMGAVNKTNLGTAQMTKLASEIDAATKEAKATGDATKLKEIYSKYVPADANTPALLSNLDNYEIDVFKAENTSRQLNRIQEIVTPTVVKAAGGKDKWDRLAPEERQRRIDQEIQTNIIEDSTGELNTITTEAFVSTSGNNEEMFPEKLRAYAVKNIAPILKIAVNPTEWQNFFVVTSVLDANGKEVIDAATGKPKMQVEQGTLASMDEAGKLNFTTARGLVQSTTTIEGVKTTEMLPENIEKGKISNQVGVAQLMPLSMSFDYKPLNPTGKLVSKEDMSWAIRIPINLSDGGKKGFIVIDGSQYTSPEFQATQQFSDAARKSMSIQINTKLTDASIERIEAKYK